MTLRLNPVLIFLIGLLAGITKESIAQICNGSLGDPVVQIDFGRGNDPFGPSLENKTNYKYARTEAPYDGEYSIVKRLGSPNAGGAWFYTQNHTPNDPNGYFMLINASFDPGIFYETDVPTDLCPNTTYEFACWVTNLLKFPGIRPNLTFQVLTMDGLVLHTLSTGDIPETNTPTWTQYGSLFSTPAGVTRVKIKIINNAPGGTGNDLAIDDITFRPCGTKITTTIDNVPNQITKTVCEKENDTFSITSNVEGTNTLQYLWQTRNGANWTDLSNETNSQIQINTSSLSPGIHEYRVMVAEPNNFNSVACRTASSPITVIVKANPEIFLPTNYQICVGQNLQLDLTGTNGTYEWTGPNNFSSTLKAPIINTLTSNHSGIYRVIVNANGCTSSTQTEVNVIPIPIATVTQPERFICNGSATLLEASGGTSYKWTPVAGLSDPNISNPIASPGSSTNYEVTVSNGTCMGKAQVQVNVYNKTAANAGTNKSIMEGASTTLNGQVSGDNLDYFWTPADYIDDPRKLNPVASPLETTTYTLNVTSLNNCPGASSSVIVKVFKKVIVPNTFTPNGDGINDVWHIEALQAYPNAELKVMNRFGEEVFSAKSNFQSWDGLYKGKILPVGTYYYWIDLHEQGQKAIVGPVTILR